MSKVRNRPDRCRDPECGIGLVDRDADPVPPGYGRHGARGLCKCCYDQHRRGGTLDQFPQLRHAAEDVAARWAEMRSAGHTYRTAAAEFGLSIRGLRAALARAREQATRAPRPKTTPPPLPRKRHSGPRQRRVAGWRDSDLFDLDVRDEGEEAS